MSNALKTVKFFKLVWIMVGSPVCACDGRTKSLLLPGPSDAFYRLISMETGNMSGVFIQILTTRTLDLDTDSNLKRWIQRGNTLRSQVAQAKTIANRTKSARLI